MNGWRFCAVVFWAAILFPLAPASAAKSTCAVLTFDAKGGVTKEEASLLSDRFAIEFDRLGQFTLISRAKMAEVLDLNQSATSAYFSGADGAIQAGKLLAVQYMVYGSVGRIGTLFTVNAYLVNVESGATEKTAITDQRGAIEDLLTSAMGRTARSLVLGPSAEEPPPPPLPAPAPQAPAKAWLLIDLYPRYAAVYLNGKPVGPGLVEAEPEMVHEIRAEAVGFAPYAQAYLLSAGQTGTVSVVLSRLPEKKPAKETLRRPRVH